MEVKTESGGSFEAAGNGTKGLAIAGLVSGAAALVGEGLLGGFNLLGNRNSNNGDEYVNQKQLNALQAYDSIFSELQKEKSERYTDQAVLTQAEKDFAANTELYKNLIDIGVGVTRIDEQVKADREKDTLREQILDLRMKAIEDKLAGAIALESERRINGDQNLFGYVNGTFVPGKLVMSADSVFPAPMPQYNSWTAPTATT